MSLVIRSSIWRVAPLCARPLVAIALQRPLGFLQVALEIAKATAQPFACTLVHPIAGVNVALDVRLGNRISDDGSSHRIRRFEADSDELTQSHGLDRHAPDDL